MTAEEAIRRIQDHMDVHRIGEYPHIKLGEALNMAIAALREREERENPKPLTLEIQNLDLRQIVLRALMSLEDQYTQTHSLMTVNVADYICQSIEKSIDKNERRWIPVTEQLPKLIPCSAGTAYSEAVNVLTPGRKVLTAIWDGTDFIADADFWDAEDEEITHWTPVLLPMPEPPKEDA